MIGMGQSASDRLVVRGMSFDKRSKTITLPKRFILFGKRRIVPFSDVESVALERGMVIGGGFARGTRYDIWRVRLYCR